MCGVRSDDVVGIFARMADGLAVTNDVDRSELRLTVRFWPSSRRKPGPMFQFLRTLDGVVHASLGPGLRRDDGGWQFIADRYKHHHDLRAQHAHAGCACSHITPHRVCTASGFDAPKKKFSP